MRDAANLHGDDCCTGDGCQCDPLDALEEKWRGEPADLAEWAARAFRTLELARRWRQSAREWEETARRGPEPV